MFWKLPLLLPIFLAAAPATTNYSLQSYGFGSGGTANSSTSNYSLEGVSGELSGSASTTTNYNLKPGFIETQQANVPKVTLTNPSSYYDKLHFIIDTQNNPTDALYALQIGTTATTCASQTNINYVKSDNTIGSTLTTADYQTDAVWAATGGNIIGLSANTTYCLQAKATQGKFTESAYGPASSAATVGQSISFCLYTSGSCGGGGNSVAFGGLLANTVSDSPNDIGVDFATNADFGGNVYIYSLNGGLKSTTASYTLSSSTATLASASEGFGAQIASINPGSGGPFSKAPPYDGAGSDVGALTTSFSTIFSSGSPVSGGSGAVQLKVKPSNITPEASDYSETLTIVAAASF